MAKRKLTFKERLNLEMMVKIGAGGIHAAADIQGILDAHGQDDPTTRQPISERARRALAELYPDGIPDASSIAKEMLVTQVNDWLRGRGLLPVSPATIMRVSGRWRSTKPASSAIPEVPASDTAQSYEQRQRAELIKLAKELLKQANDPPPPVEASPPRNMHKRQIAIRALAGLYPNGVPDAASLSNQRLIDHVDRFLKNNGLPSVGDNTILRAAGRR